MQKLLGYVILLVIGLAVGISVGVFVLMPQSPSMGEQVKVTIEGIDFTSSETLLEIRLENNVPEKNLEGNVTVYQAEKQWTSEVTWYYTGYGVAEVICDSINETQNFRVTYIENYPKATYLDRIINWNEVSLSSLTFSFAETEQLTFTKIAFVNSGSAINVTVVNTGTADVTITAATVTGYNITGSSITGKAIERGKTETVSIALTGNWVEGNSYMIELLSSKGNKFPYTATA